LFLQEKGQPVEMVPEGSNCMRKILLEHKLEMTNLTDGQDSYGPSVFAMAANSCSLFEPIKNIKPTVFFFHNS